MSYDTAAGYGTPPFPPYNYPDPSLNIRATPPVSYDVSTGEFYMVLNQPTRLEAGTSGRFSAYFKHKIDGPISTFTTGPTVSVRDGNGNAVTSGVTIGTVTEDQNPGVWFSVVQFLSSVQPGNYELQWTASYTPTNTQEPQVALPIQVRRGFIVTNTKAPSQYFFKTTASY